MVPPADSSHYFDSDPSIGSSVKTISLVLPDMRLELRTDRGVFARDRVDAGTKLLLLDPPPIQGSDRAGELGPSRGPTPVSPTDGAATDERTLVDVGAGYGPIACVLASRNPTATVWAVEVNGRARELCRQNAELAGLSNVIVVGPEDVPEDLRVDEVWSNPPIRIGKSQLHELLISWLTRLQPTGTGQLVVQRHLGADSLQRWLVTQGWEVRRRRSRKAFRLLEVTRPDVESQL